MYMRMNKDELTMNFQQIQNSYGALVTREIVSAWSGQKVSRIVLKPKQVKKFSELTHNLGLEVTGGVEKIFSKRDVGKGGWSNKFDDKPSKLKVPDKMLYVGLSKSQCEKAKQSEENNDEGSLGKKLGIPDCCVNFYLNNQEEAYKNQNDYVPLVLKNSANNYPFNFWNNYVAQYFGYSLLSFFPCSFNCSNAANFSENTYDLLKSIIPNMADKTLHFHKQPILYTEYRGIFLFENAKYNSENKELDIGKGVRLHSTLSKSSKTLKKVEHSKTIRVLGKNNVELLNSQNDIIQLKSDKVCMCLFN